MRDHSDNVDYENGCRRCGGCCTPVFKSGDELIRIKELRCVHSMKDNLCDVYDNRVALVGCMTAEEIGIDFRPDDCSFGGKVKSISYTEMKSIPDGFIGTLISGLFARR